MIFVDSCGGVVEVMCVCVRLHHAARARCSCGWLFEEAGTVQHQQPPVSND